MTLDLTHLPIGIRERAFDGNSDRIRQVRAANWVGYARATRALDRLEELIEHPACARMPCLLLYGESGMGKTMIVESCCECSNVDLAGGTASDVAKPYSLLNINFYDSCSVFPRDGKRGFDQHASHRGSRGGQAI